MNMNNFGFLSAIYSLFSFEKDKENSEPIGLRFKKNSLKAIVSILLLTFFLVTLIKVYQVPVYVTKINLVTDNCLIDDNHKLDIRIFRNYDRTDRRSVERDSVWKKYNPKEHYSGGIYITGNLTPAIGMMNEAGKKVNKIKENLNEIVKNKNITPLEDPQLAYLSVQTSIRQSNLLTIGTEYEVIEPYKDTHVTTTYFDGKEEKRKEYDVKNHYYYKHVKTDDSGSLAEFYFVSSKDDNSIPVIAYYGNNSFGHPSLIMAAEDISKLVEVVYIGNLDKLKKQHAGAWAFTNSLTIDYDGPTDFSDHISPAPDSITLSSIIYTDKGKIEQIGRKGLRFHASFPDMENRQETRIFVLSGIITGLCALLFKYLWRLLCDLCIIGIPKLNTKPRLLKTINTIIILGIIAVFIWYILVVFKGPVDPYNMHNPLVE